MKRFLDVNLYLLNTCEQAVAYHQRFATAGFGILYDTFHANIEEKDVLAGLRHSRIVETIAELERLGYDVWLTIEAFGRAVPELAAATRAWRDFFASPEEVYTEGYALIRDTWEQGVSA
jgi:D-psicose/D-tagatose/L-ribulose 3-epimerase